MSQDDQGPAGPQMVPIDMDAAAIEAASDRALLILKVHPASPAAHFGVQKSWRLLTVNGRAPDDATVFKAQMQGGATVVFADATGQQAHQLSGAVWPFGIVTVPWPGSAYARSIEKAQFDREDMTRFWKEGVLSPYPQFIDPLERYLSRGTLGLFERLKGQRVSSPDMIASVAEYPVLALLSLSYATAGQMDAAAYYLDATRASRQRAAQASYSSIDMSMDAYTESLIAEATGEHERALDAMRRAAQSSPDIEEVERRLAALEGRAPAMSVPRYTLERFPVTYDLPRTDPIGELKQPDGMVSLSETLAALEGDELLLVLVLGDYRSNYYYNLDILRLAILNKALPGMVKAVHAITAGTYALDANHRRACEAEALSLGLPLELLYDEADRVSGQLFPDGYPARFFLDRDATVLATERIMEEEGFWLAQARRAELAPSATPTGSTS
ncbi:MAG: hypothetical protein AAFR04_14505 [Pseudomonadota bacterium]